METLRDMMTKDVTTCSTDDNIYQAAKQMKALNVGAIPVTSGDQLIGMITDRDIVIRGVAEKKPETTKITDIMTDEIITGTPDMDVNEAAKLMSKNQIRRLPIVEGTKLVGICALGDLAVRDELDKEAEVALSEISENHDYGKRPQQ